MELTEAYRECERITWSAARNFAYGIRLLPPDKRRGLAVIYAFARRIDDIGDGTMHGAARLAVAGYVAGGRAALAAIRARRYDVLSGTPKPRKPRLAVELAKTYVRGR